MKRGRIRALATALLLLVLGATAPRVLAQEWDPASAVAAYSAALNAHDLPAALALFDQYGSATDAAGHHYEGGAGLTEFLLASGFATPDAHITTQNLHVVANRAVWTYACSCATGSTQVRLVLNRARISVFAMMALPASPASRPSNGLLPWLVALGLVVAGLCGGIGLRRRQSGALGPRVTQGRLLAALLHARAERPGGLGRS
jgi:hypothetical protein